MRVVMLLAILLLPGASRDGWAANAVAALPLVDPAVRAIPKCTTRFVSFRIPTDGWLADHCGGIFRRVAGLVRGAEPLACLSTASRVR